MSWASATLSSSIQSKTQFGSFSNHSTSVSVFHRSWNLKVKSLRFGRAIPPQRIALQCNSSSTPGPPSGSGDGDSRSVLDAFFLGKALAEALNERVESAVGEFLSTVGRLQAEQQKQVQEFQEDVLERAKKAKEQAARETMEARGLVPKSSVVNTASATISPSNSSGGAPVSSSSLSDPITPDAETDPDPTDKGPVLGFANEE
ncbi:hypothetical protein Dsin_019708 [Dipteronia sinensis]|uniref:Uncharacterized protein n=1 Tax=Dipteronia sinensis TaxID=43782 RepID=A0AAE0E2S4_9ROSI|nr:hypothetical protein Dsin_019708 [Dipteronia sinensis]